MSIFQPSVLKSHIALLDHKAVDKAYKQFAQYFLDPKIQENIKVAKEEQYQATFLNELFVKIFGYTLFPDKDHNLVTEQKNEGNSRKADGAILKGDAVTAVIELKGTKTKDLESIRKQAFDYKNFNTGCNYVITSNFEKLRFYIDDASTHEEFDLFSLSRKQFELLYLCLNKEQLMQHTPKSIKEESLVEEEKITKSFYKDYSNFKRELWKDLAKNNIKSLKVLAAQHRSVENELAEGSTTESNDDLTQLEKNVKRTLFKKSQKLIDRFLFIFFAEDRGLLQPNYTLKSIAEWEMVRKLGVEETLYDRFKKHFTYLDQGRKKDDGISEIFAYNGGLFKPDTILDHIVIDDELLLKHTKKIATYDFESQVDVNILGHIFENSLNEIESVNAEIDGADFDKQTSKRKKDGVFYTPKYITKYIVDNTVGKLCEEKKTELGFAESEYYRGRKNRNKSTLEHLVKILDDYREWLLQLTICDPACGSGAFLNQALDFLITEHTYIDELKAKLLGTSMILSDIENTILENNIYGVDLNEESVEIAKLSLWLRTAQPRRKLNDLSSNIKCGNSLIDAKAVAGDKAFKWEEEFPQVFEKGGFDVVIGNPPYVLVQPSNTHEKVLNFLKNYKVSSYKIDLYHLFFEKSLGLIKDEGFLSFITPNTFLTNKYIKSLRTFILEHSSIIEIVNYEDPVFHEAGVDVATITLSKSSEMNPSINIYSSNNGALIALGTKSQIEWYKTKEQTFNLNKPVVFNIDLDGCRLLEEFCSVTFGLQTKDKSTYVLNIKKDEEWERCYTGKDINKYYLKEATLYFKNTPSEVKAGGSWNMDIHHSEKIVIRQVGNPEPIAAYDQYGYATLNTMYSIVVKQENWSYSYLLAIINSKLMKQYFLSKYADGKQLFPKIKGYQIKSLPIKEIEFSHQKLIGKSVDTVTQNIEYFENNNSRFQNYFQQTLGLEKLSRKLQNWHELTFAEFIKELNKAIKTENRNRKKEAVNGDYQEIPTLTKKDEFEWMELFEEKKKEILELKSQIHHTEKEIDQMVYELYGLSEEEIKIVEGS